MFFPWTTLRKRKIPRSKPVDSSSSSPVEAAVEPFFYGQRSESRSLLHLSGVYNSGRSSSSSSSISAFRRQEFQQPQSQWYQHSVVELLSTGAGIPNPDLHVMEEVVDWWLIMEEWGRLGALGLVAARRRRRHNSLLDDDIVDAGLMFCLPAPLPRAATFSRRSCWLARWQEPLVGRWWAAALLQKDGFTGLTASTLVGKRKKTRKKVFLRE
ncbi:hypothetical protein ZIOFF_040462 [Zingiber officinale]|uniref:Uncharacterized protein n=1 Tax=Zingiber officinale TaxID=94328 RepID=A0A8J5GCN1_ZINOF|nr:hypothetical protein ZIOFF_040462 [Zingiber officinale]